MIFVGQEFFRYDFDRNKWEIGDLVGEGLFVPESSSIIALDRSEHKTELFSAIVTGGISDG